MSRAPEHERRSQVRGLLLLAAVGFGFILWRAYPVMHLFHAGWWRF